MKMTDADSAKDLCRRFDELVNAPSGGSQEEWSEWQCDAAAELLHVAARLAADQQKGGGGAEHLAGSVRFVRDFLSEYDEHEEHEWSETWRGLAARARHLSGEAIDRAEAAYLESLSEDPALDGWSGTPTPRPQPSIPAPAQQDGKASGGDENLLTDLDDYLQGCPDPANVWPKWMIKKSSRLLWRCRAALAHPPHADQETQG